MSLLSWWAPVWDFPFLPADFGLWTFWSFLTDIIILNSRESGLSFLSLEDSEFLYAKCLTPSIMAQQARERHHLCLLMVRMSCESLNSEQGGAYYPYSLKSKTGAFIFFKKKKSPPCDLLFPPLHLIIEAHVVLGIPSVSTLFIYFVFTVL